MTRWRPIWYVLAQMAMSCASAPPVDPAHRDAMVAWQGQRRERLVAPEGWLSLVGLFWLEEGENRIGSAPTARVRLPARLPAETGVLVRRGAEVQARFTIAGMMIDGAAVRDARLASDAEGEPTIVRQGSVAFFVIARGERIGVRVKDSEAATRTQFRGLEYFPIDSRWRALARFIPYAAPQRVEIPSVIGTSEAMLVPGAVEMELPGGSARLDVVLEEPGADELFIIFADATNGDETYGAGRFLYVPKPACMRADGTGCQAGAAVTVDFNRAYNPPCAFTPYATCPLPPPQNRLALAVRSGERRYQGGH